MEVTDEEEECPGEGECTDYDCEHMREYEVEWTVTYTGTIRAHSEDEARGFADEIDIPSTEPFNAMSFDSIECTVDQTIVDIKERDFERWKRSVEYEAMMTAERAKRDAARAATPYEYSPNDPGST